MSTLKKNAKMFGYLEKRGKMTLTGRWRKWWCVLEGQLLLYYKSEKQYSKLSPCYGSLNIALVKSIQPHSGRQIHIETHSQLVILRGTTKEKQQSWFNALISVLPHGNYPKSPGNSILNQWDARWISEAYRKGYNRGSTKKRVDSVRKRHLKPSPQFGTFENVSGKLINSGETVEPSSVCDLNNQIFKEIQKNKKFTKPDKIILDSSKSFSTDNLKAVTHITAIKMKKFSSYHCITITSFEGETEKVEVEKRSISCECLHLSDYKRKDETDVFQRDREKNRSLVQHVPSFLEMNQRNLNVSVSPHGRQKSITTGPWHFLKKLLHNRKSSPSIRNAEQKYSNQEQGLHEQDASLQTPTPCVIDDVTEVQVDDNCREEVTDAEQTGTQTAPESTSDANGSDEGEESRSLVWIRAGDYPTNDESPELPAKQKVNSSEYSSKIAELNSNPYNSVGKAESNPTQSASSSDLDHLLLQLSDVLRTENATHESNESSTFDEEPDYDFPIPHASLIDRIVHQTSADYNYSSTNLIARCDNLISLDMTPDSLEVPPWMLSHPKRINSWLDEDNYHFYDDGDSESENDAMYHDSLNSSRIYS